MIGVFSFRLALALAQAPTDIADHVRTWLVWLPIIITPLFIFLAHDLLMSRLEGGLTEEEIVQSSRNPDFMKWFRSSPQKVISFMAVLAVLLWVFFGELFADVRVVSFPIAWTIFANWVFRHPLIDARYPSIVKNVATYLPSAFFFAFFLGANSANTQMQQSSNTHRIEFAGTTQGRVPEEIRLLRSFQDWVLIRDEGGKIAWIPENNVGRIQLLEESEAFGGVVCVFFSTRWCRDD